MDVQLLERLLVESKLVSDVRYFEKISSTNSFALQLAGDDQLATPLLIVAREQSAGRGRGANRWWSSEGCLMFSLLVDAESWLPKQYWPHLSLVTGVSIAQVIEQQLPGEIVGVKWPNDVYMAGRKLAGILIETSAAAPGRLVIGAGVNVNNSVAQAPAEIQARAISLVDRTARPISLEATLARVVEQLLTNWRSLARDGFTSFASQWPRYCILTGSIATIRTSARDAGEVFSGRVAGIDSHGRLLVETAQGTVALAGGAVESFEPAI